MARLAIPLSDKAIKAAVPREDDGKLYDVKLFDGGGLFLLVTKTGAKRWRLKYRFNGSEKVLALGVYPTVSLAKARKYREKYKSQISDGINPAEERKEKNAQDKSEQAKKKNTFKNVVKESLEKRNTLSESYKHKLECAFARDTFPYIGNKSIEDITKQDIMKAVERVEKRGAIESAHRLLTQINKVFKFALAREYIEKNVCEKIDREHELKTHKATKYPTITDEPTIKILLNMIDEYSGDFSTKMALTLAPYVALRPENIRKAEWSEIDFENRVWVIPAEKMKIKEQGEHVIPLTDRAIEILREVQPYSGDSKYIFYSLRNPNSPMSDNTLNQALKRMGFTGEQLVPHGFRAMFSTITNKLIGTHGIHPKVIDVQLAHSAKSKVEESYNRTDYMEERVKLMQWWSDYLDKVKKGSSK